MKTLVSIVLAGVAVLLAAGELTSQTSAVGEGARVYAENCSRCHNLRSPAERDNRDWVTIMLHMRARANLTKSEANAVRVFVQATNGIGDSPVTSGAQAPPSGDEQDGYEEMLEATLAFPVGAQPSFLSDELVASLDRYLNELRMGRRFVR